MNIDISHLPEGKKSAVYLVQHLESKKIYVGVVKDARRLPVYMTSSKNKDFVLELTDHPERFKCSILEIRDDFESAAALEQEILLLLFSLVGESSLYNLCAYYSSSTKFFSEKTRVKGIQTKQTEEYRQKIRSMYLGEKSHRAKLTEQQVREIYELRISGWSIKAIAEKFEVTPGNVRIITRGGNWPHLYDEYRERLQKYPKRRVFTEEEVIGVYTRISEGVNLNAIAKEYVCSKEAISTLFKGRSWKKLHSEYAHILPASAPNKRKLSKDDVREIRAKYASGEPKANLAQRFFVSYSAVTAIVTGRIWKNLD